VETLPDFALNVEVLSRSLLIDRLQKKNVKFYPNTRINDVTENDVVLQQEGNQLLAIDSIDTIVIAAGAKPNDELAKNLKNKGILYFTIGDCKEPRDILYAVQEGFCLAYIL